MGLAKRIFGLFSIMLAAAWELKYEAIRAILYERGWTMLTEHLDAEFPLHYGTPTALVALGIGLFVWSKPPKVQASSKRSPSTKPPLPDGLPDLRVADHKRVATLFESEERDKLFPLMESETLLVWARPMKGNNTLMRLPGSTWRTHFLVCLPKEGQWDRAVTFVKMMAGQQSIWEDVYFNQKQIEQVWPELEWIPLLTAARLAYEAVEAEGLEKLFVSSSDTASEKIVSIIDSIMVHEEIELWGKKPPSTVLRPIPHSEHAQLHPVPNTSNLGPVFASEPNRWEDVVIQRADLDDYLAGIRALSQTMI